MNARAEDQLINITGKSKQWLVGVLLVALIVCSVTTVPLISSNIETTLTYDPSSQTLTVVKIRSRIQRLFCLDEESRVTYDMTQLKYMYIRYGCCSRDGLEFDTSTSTTRKVKVDLVFDEEDLKRLVDTVDPFKQDNQRNDEV
ncbi:MAG: hypothetical protein EZS28_013443 [Streblomastix strix]|uniref:Uncharacterized protein n=1 Tax=Streblomastix strix TaxID=222440 RepID=A0A5J4W839_9EUKA|nr:MAG: hypothetical protein EZS28_013443 [Streblomastix strix]